MATDDQKKCGGFLFISLFVIGISAAMITMGALNLDWTQKEGKQVVEQGKCRASPNIPAFNFTGGIVLLLLLVIRGILQVSNANFHPKKFFLRQAFSRINVCGANFGEEPPQILVA